MENQIYTHALWKVKPGNEEAFVQAWADLAEAFSSLERPPLWGTLIQSTTESNVFYSFGPWKQMADVEAMRNSEEASIAITAIRELCEEATPRTYKVIKHVVVE